MTAIGDWTFSDCRGLTSITIPSSVTSIGNSAFFMCRSLTSITIPSNVTSIESQTFAYCGLTSITIPNSVTSIGEYAFGYCSDLASITIPNSVTTIGEHAFENCISLTSISIPSSVTSIGNGAFLGCRELISITIPNSVIEIGSYVFSDCSGLTSVTIPNSVTSIGDGAFEYCRGLLDFYCYAENVPGTASNIFKGSNIGNATLHVPAASISAYQAVEPWKNFKEIVALPAQCPMVKEGRTWVYEYHDFDEEEEFDHEEDVFDVSYTIQGDTVIGGVSYVKLMRQQDGISTYYAALREEGTAVFEIMAGKSDEYKILEFDPTKLSSMLGIYCDYTERKEVIRVNGREFVRHIYEPGDDPLFFPRLIAVEGVGFWCTGLVHGVYMELPTCPCDYEIFKACYEDGECIFTNEDFEYTDPQTNADYTYRPFVEEGKVWKVGSTLVTDNLVNLVDYYYFDGETVIKGKTCKQMMRQRYVSPDFPEYDSYSQQPSLDYVGAWYEEDKKVYVYDTVNKQFTMMYDFGLDDNGIFQFNNLQYVVGPKQTGGINGFKGVYREVWECGDGGNTFQCAPWMEGVGVVYGPPTTNVFNVELADPAWYLMSCTVGDEVIYLNDEYEDGASPSMGARKRRIDFTHTIKIQPKTRIKREKNDACIGSSEREVARPKVKARTRNGAEESMYGEYNDQQLCINIDPLDDTYFVCITDESGKAVYEKNIYAGNIVGLNIDISAYPEGRYAITIENSHETFTGEFEAQTTGIKEVSRKQEVLKNHIYNLQGQRLDTLQKGLNIVNGQKVFVK